MMRLFVISLLSLFFLSGCEEKAPPSSPPDASISPLDAFVSRIKDIPAQSESEDYTHSFELFDYDITLSDSLVYTHNCVMRFISTSKRSDYSASAASEYSSSFRYNAESKEWELSSLERTNIDYDFTGNEDLVKIQKIGLAAENFLGKIKPLVDRSERLAGEGIILVSRKLKLENEGKYVQKKGEGVFVLDETASAEIKEIERKLEKIHAERDVLGPQITTLEKEAKPLMDQNLLSDALSKKVTSIKRLIRLQDFENVLKNTLKDFDDDESVFKKRYEYDAEKGTLNRR